MKKYNSIYKKYSLEPIRNKYGKIVEYKIKEVNRTLDEIIKSSIISKIIDYK